jgi:hypothetical protein
MVENRPQLLQSRVYALTSAAGTSNAASALEELLVTAYSAAAAASETSARVIKQAEELGAIDPLVAERARAVASAMDDVNPSFLQGAWVAAQELSEAAGRLAYVLETQFEDGPLDERALLDCRG